MISKVTENLYIGEYFNIVGQTPEETQSRFEQIQGLGIGTFLVFAVKVLRAAKSWMKLKHLGQVFIAWVELTGRHFFAETSNFRA